MKKFSGKLPYIAAFVASIIFGFSFLFTKGALDYLDTFQLLGFRFIVAALFLTILGLIGVIKVKVNFSLIKGLIILAIFQPILYFIFETIGVGLTSASESGIMVAFEPIMVTVLAVLIIKERLSILQWISVFVSVIGVVFIVLAKGGDLASGHFLGIMALLASIVSAGFYSIFSKKQSTIYNPVEITFVMMWVGAIAFNIPWLYRIAVHSDMIKYISPLGNISVLTGILYLGIMSSVVAFFLLNYAFANLEASKVSVFFNFIPICAVFAGVCFRGEKFYVLQGVGCVLILLGIWGTNGTETVVKVEKEFEV